MDMVAPNTFSADERNRYARHLLLPEVGEAGQQKLKNARVLLVGLGGLGSPIALYLAAAGIGTLGLVDADSVDISNMHRQVLYGTDDIGKPKAEAAQKRLHATNPHVRCMVHKEKFTAANAESLLKDYDFVVDGTDNFLSHYLINDACILHRKTLVYGSVSRFDGMVSVVKPRHSACYRCLYPSPPPPDHIPNCAEAGVLGVIPGLVGMVQANEVVKLVLGIGTSLAGRVLMIDGLHAGFKDISLPRDNNCSVCGDKNTMNNLNQIDGAPMGEITADELKKEMASANPPFLLDVRNQNEFDERRIAGSHLIPLPVLAQRFGELDPKKDMVVHCKLGGRSAAAIKFLQTQGFTKMRNLVGGIEAY